jgi:hypothetical protein
LAHRFAVARGHDVDELSVRQGAPKAAPATRRGRTRRRTMQNRSLDSE